MFKVVENTMLKIILCKGAPASLKSTWAKKEIALDPLNWIRINNDEIRAMANGSVYSADYEKLIRSTRNFLVKEALGRNLSVILDNVNSSKSNWDDTIKIAKEANKDVEVSEKLFYCPLEDLLERNAKREGSARVPDEVVRKFFSDLGRDKFANAVPRVEVLSKRDFCLDMPFTPVIQNKNAVSTIVCDLDGTATISGGRPIFDATNCHLDTPNIPVIETVKLFHDKGYHIIFCSGREDKYEAPTRQFIEQHMPNIKYDLFMRKSNDFRRDAIIKEEIYDNHIKDKFNILFILEDRRQVVELWRDKLGLTVFQVAWGNF